MSYLHPTYRAVATGEVGPATLGWAPATGVVVVYDTSAVASVNVSSSTANAALTKADNQAMAPASYTFLTTADVYTRIFSAQCDRVSNYIFGQLEQLDRSDDDQNEGVIDNIARVIGLVGEPAAYTAILEARFLKNEPFAFEQLLLALATARQKETEPDLVRTLFGYAEDGDYKVKRAAVRALGRMNTNAAKRALAEISLHNRGAEIGQYAAALLR
jgi:HEAT repeat protein